MSTPHEDIEFLVSSDHRVGVLDALDGGARDRDELRAETGASSPTMSRILADFEDRNWIEQEERTYRLTGLGAFVADRLSEFLETMTVERRLRDVWQWLPHEFEGFDIELFTDVTVSHPGPGYPYEPVERRTELIEGSALWRGFGMAMLELRTLDTFFERVLGGEDELVCEYIYPPEVFEELLAWDAETIVEAATGDSYTVLLHEELRIDDRFEVCLFDDRVTICCYDHETGALQALVETTSPGMRSWAKTRYERYRSEARPLEDATDLVSVDSLR